MTRVSPSKRFVRDLDQVPEYIRVKVIVWVEFVEAFGLTAMRRRSGYRDKALIGKRKGQRSVRLNRSYRLIYEEKLNGVEILLLEVNRHDY